MNNTFWNLLFIGDVVAQAGCDKLKAALPALKREKQIDICIANGENSAQGNGMTPDSAEQLFSAGVDFITGGNHTFRRREIPEMTPGTLIGKMTLRNTARLLHPRSCAASTKL